MSGLRQAGLKAKTVISSVGAWMGWQMLLPIIVFASGVGAVIGVVVMIRQRKGRDTQIAFGPKACYVGNYGPERVGTSAAPNGVLYPYSAVGIREIEDGTTMIVVTHEMGFARDVSDLVMFLHNGLIEEEGTPRAIFGAPKSERLRQFISKHLH